MDLVKLIILWLSASESLGKIFDVTSKTREFSSLVGATVEILSSCYGKKARTVGLAGTLSGTLVEALGSKEFLSLALVGNDTRTVRLDRKSRHKFDTFVVTASSSTQLNQTLGQIKRSLWWNHMATFIILDWHSTTSYGCSNAFRFLWTAWRMNILDALYLCEDQTEKRLIYSFNPYTNKAPNAWQLENTFKGENNHPWSLFRLEYDADDKKICENLQFDKTSDLGGYKIYSSVKEFPPFEMVLRDVETDGRFFDGYIGQLVTTIFRALNATPHLIIHDKRIAGMYDKLGNDIAMDTVNGISDICLNVRLLTSVLNYTVSRAYSGTELSILTQHSGDQSQLNKLLAVIDRSNRLGICLVFVMTVILFKCFLRQPIGSAVLNVWRIATNSTLLKVPNGQAARLYLAGVFFLVVTIVGIYQGKLASLLTKPKALPNVERMQDLVDRDYTIHGHKTYAYLFTDPAIKSRFVGHESFECWQIVVRDSSAACVGQKINLIEMAAKYNLHLSREPAIKSFGVFVIREDWPLEKRFNRILQGLQESHVAKRIAMARALKTQSTAKFYESENDKDQFRVIVLSELTFAFAILGIGLGLATVCFVFEAALSRLRPKKKVHHSKLILIRQRRPRKSRVGVSYSC